MPPHQDVELVAGSYGTQRDAAAAAAACPRSFRVERVSVHVRSFSLVARALHGRGGRLLADETAC